MLKSEFLLFCLVSLVRISIQGEVFKPNYDTKTDGVVELSQKNFKSLVLNSDDRWLVIFEFSGPTCNYCVKLSEVIKKAVPLLKAKKINVGYVNYMTAEGKQLADSYKITMFPVVYIFGKEKEYPISYPYSPGSAEELANAVEFLMNKPPAAEGQCGKDTVQNPEAATYELTDENFETVVLKCEDPWLVNFYVPDVDLCIKFKPFFEAAAKEFKGRAKFGSFFQMGSKVAEKYGAMRVCTVKWFPAGNKNRQPVDFNNGSHSTIISTNLIPWVKTALAASLPAPGINEDNYSRQKEARRTLTSQSVLDTKCKNSGVTSCVFLFLPKDDQCNSDCKRTNLNLLTQVANELKGENWAWFWTSQGKQPDFEQTFGIKSFPGALGIDLKSNSYSVLRGTGNGSKLKEFYQFFASARFPSKNLPTSGIPAVKGN